MKAVIDCGTNTFNLLTGKKESNGKLFVAHEASRSVKLRLEQLPDGSLAPQAIQRGVDALKALLEEAWAYSPNQIIATGTAALRDAPNATDFIEAVKQETGLQIKVITGQSEAALIFEGVKNLLPSQSQSVLIMDIGGGSTEFILASEGKTLWQHSFPLGVSKIAQHIQASDPILPSEIKALRNFLTRELNPLFGACAQMHSPQLIGSSGAFESIVHMLHPARYGESPSKDARLTPIPLDLFSELSMQLCGASQSIRLQIPGLVPFRADSIHLASLLIETVIEKLEIKEFFFSPFSLKEGILLSECFQ